MKPREKVIAGLDETLMALFRVDSMAAVPRACGAEKIADYQLDHYTGTIQSLLAPTYEALKDAIKLLEGKEPPPSEGGAA